MELKVFLTFLPDGNSEKQLSVFGVKQITPVQIFLKGNKGCRKKITFFKIGKKIWVEIIWSKRFLALIIFVTSKAMLLNKSFWDVHGPIGPRSILISHQECIDAL